MLLHAYIYAISTNEEITSYWKMQYTKTKDVSNNYGNFEITIDCWTINNNYWYQANPVFLELSRS